MANIKSSIKRARQMKTCYLRNSAYRSGFRTAVKKLLYAINAKDEKDKLIDLYRQTVKKIDQTAQKGLIKKNKAARYKSRLNQKVKQAVS